MPSKLLNLSGAPCIAASAMSGIASSHPIHRRARAILLSLRSAAKQPASRLAPVIALLAMTSLAHPQPQKACRQAILEAELTANQPYSHAIGNGLRLYFQPIHSGWITRILPLTSPAPAHDYAELATPPYQSVTPLSLSTDFAFRAQDAVGWNPRRFRFATSPAAFQQLAEAYKAYQQTLDQAPLAPQIAKAAEATLTILDARLTPGTADQWFIAGSVASHFLTTAHTLVPPPDGASTPLGRLLWLRFRFTFDLPPAFNPAPGLKILPHLCGTT